MAVFLYLSYAGILLMVSAWVLVLTYTYTMQIGITIIKSRAYLPYRFFDPLVMYFFTIQAAICTYIKYI